MSTKALGRNPIDKEVDAYIARNLDAINASIDEARKSFRQGKGFTIRSYADFRKALRTVRSRRG